MPNKVKINGIMKRVSKILMIASARLLRNAFAAGWSYFFTGSSQKISFFIHPKDRESLIPKRKMPKL